MPCVSFLESYKMTLKVCVKVSHLKKADHYRFPETSWFKKNTYDLKRTHIRKAQITPSLNTEWVLIDVQKNVYLPGRVT